MHSRVIFAFVLFLLLSGGPALSTAAHADEFAWANELYEQKEYDSAIQAYARIIYEGIESASLYFNLGNACFKKGDLGHAIEKCGPILLGSTGERQRHANRQAGDQQRETHLVSSHVFPHRSAKFLVTGPGSFWT